MKHRRCLAGAEQSYLAWEGSHSKDTLPQGLLTAGSTAMLLCCSTLELFALNKRSFFTAPQIWDSCWCWIHASDLQLIFCSHSSCSSPSLMGRNKGKTTFTGDVLRDGPEVLLQDWIGTVEGRKEPISRTRAWVRRGNGGCECQISLSFYTLTTSGASHWLGPTESWKQGSAGSWAWKDQSRKERGEEDWLWVGQARAGQTKQPALLC